jgi:glucose dehydrogenase
MEAAVSHPVLFALGLALLALCALGGSLYFIFEGRSERYAGALWARTRDSVVFALTTPLWILYAVAVNLAALLPWGGPSRLLAKLK